MKNNLRRPSSDICT